MSDTQKTHFADDATLALIAKLEAEIEQLECELKLAYAAVEKLKSENEALREELEPLRRDYTASIQRMGDLELEIEGEVKENAALRTDAERYRWLRGNVFVDVIEDDGRYWTVRLGDEKELDTAIDAARKERP